MRRRRICVFTGTRAEYGLLEPLMRQIREDADLDLCLIVSGTHLSPEFGSTYKMIEADGFTINEKVEILLSSDSAIGVSKSMGLGMIGYSEALERLKPEMIVLLGDRFETFSAAVASLLHHIPIAHIHGGEASFGAWDDAFRHGITKMSLLHFTSAETYRKRVIQLGEHPDRVFNVGSPGVENINKMSFIAKEDLYRWIGFDTRDPFFLVTYHPVTLENSNTEKNFKELLDALSDKRFEKYKIVFTDANADSYGRMINRKIADFVACRPKRAVSFSSMGQVRYLSAMKYSSVVIGNSSSGIIEAPGFKIPVVNIGNRQKGRIRSDNIIDCTPEKNEIIKAIDRSLSKEFLNAIKDMANPFEKAGTAKQIKDIIRNFDLAGTGLKEFYDCEQ